MSFSDKVFGMALLSLSISIFTYYTTWVIVLPFIEPPNPLHNFFPPVVYAIAIPATLLVAGIVIISIFIGVVLVRESRKVKTK
mmetsp:Transcript_33716/g.34344  ORF Transcript_33716/g.34344 Transcript_33716/m.34344 type:complete len:83 (+) Transcript_33716:293-541(+)